MKFNKCSLILPILLFSVSSCNDEEIPCLNINVNDSLYNIELITGEETLKNDNKLCYLDTYKLTFNVQFEHINAIEENSYDSRAVVDLGFINNYDVEAVETEVINGGSVDFHRIGHSLKYVADFNLNKNMSLDFSKSYFIFKVVNYMNGSSKIETEGFQTLSFEFPEFEYTLNGIKTNRYDVPYTLEKNNYDFDINDVSFGVVNNLNIMYLKIREWPEYSNIKFNYRDQSVFYTIDESIHIDGKIYLDSSINQLINKVPSYNIDDKITIVITFFETDFYNEKTVEIEKTLRSLGITNSEL